MAEITSFFGQLLIAIQDRIVDKVPEIRWIDQDLGQLEYYDYGAGQKPQVAFPCLLIDFGNTDYSEQSQRVQWASVTIMLRLGFPPFSHSDHKAPLEVRANALKYYELEQKIYQALQGWDANELCQGLTRTGGVTEKREDPIRVRVMTFTTVFDDDSAVPENSTVTKPVITFDFTP